MVDIRIVGFIFKCMSKYNIIAEKPYAFAIRIVKLYKSLQQEKREFTLSKQILRAGTSIGTNVLITRGMQSDKECRETEY